MKWLSHLVYTQAFRVRVPGGLPALSYLDDGTWLRTKTEAGSIPAERTVTEARWHKACGCGPHIRGFESRPSPRSSGVMAASQALNLTGVGSSPTGTTESRRKYVRYVRLSRGTLRGRIV